MLQRELSSGSAGLAWGGVLSLTPRKEEGGKAAGVEDGRGVLGLIRRCKKMGFGGFAAVSGAVFQADGFD